MSEPVAGMFDAELLAGLEVALGAEAVGALLDAFRADLRHRPARILAQAVAGDLAGARADAHALKGAALVVGARAISAGAERVESADPADIVQRAADLAREAVPA